MTRILRLSCILIAFVITLPLCADSKNPADYPLRLHIFNAGGTTFFHNRVPEETRGDGRANLFENGQPRAVEFTFNCAQKVRPSFEFETYPAKWKKPNAELLVLLPVYGKANAYFTCTLKTDVKDYAYFTRNGRLDAEPPEQFKAWMAAHDYDPEHGKNTPNIGAASSAPAELEQARRYLTGSNKDTEKARKLLLEIVQSGSAKAVPEDLVWADIYLGYIEDRANHRETAIGWYQKALAVEGAPPGSLDLARNALRRPLTWIRHLDNVTRPPDQ